MEYVNLDEKVGITFIVMQLITVKREQMFTLKKKIEYSRFNPLKTKFMKTKPENSIPTPKKTQLSSITNIPFILLRETSNTT